MFGIYERNDKIDIGLMTTPIKFYKITQTIDSLGGVTETKTLDFTLYGKVASKIASRVSAYNIIEDVKVVTIYLINNGKIDYKHIVEIDDFNGIYTGQYKITGIGINNDDFEITDLTLTSIEAPI